jgi:cytochrome P450
MTQEVLYNPADPLFADHASEIYRTLRDEHPLYADPTGRFHALSRFDDVRNACTDWETFSSVGKQESQFIKITMNSLDPPRHTAMRALIARGFTPRRVADLDGTIRAIARGLIDGFIDAGRVDAIAEYAAILPSVVMGRLIGLSDADIRLCRELTDEFMHQTQPHGQKGPASRSYDVFGALLAERRLAPQDDLMSALLGAEIDGIRLTQDELLGFGWLLLVGGNDTTTNLIGNGLELFARHPDQRRLLIDDTTLLGDAVDEVLRAASPTHTLPRVTARDAVTGHGTIPAGSRALIPGDDQMPAAPTVPRFAEHVLRVLRLRSDLDVDLRRAMGLTDDELRRDASATAAVGYVVAAAYYLSPDVRQCLDYVPEPASPAPARGFPEYMDEGLLDHLLV